MLQKYTIGYNGGSQYINQVVFFEHITKNYIGSIA